MREEKTPVANNVLEINLLDLFWSVLSHWRGILVAALVLALCLGGWKGFSLYNSIQDPDYLAQAEAFNDRSLSAYDSMKANLEARMDSITRELEEREAYEANSALFAIDPYNVSVEERSYYIDTGYEILPENMFQNPNYNIPVVSAYKTALTRLNIGEILSAEFGLDNLLEYDASSSFLSISTDSTNGLLHVKVIGANPEQAKAIVQAAEAALRETEPTIQSTIHEHTLTEIAANSYQTISDDLVTLHQNRRSESAKLNDAFFTAMESYSELKEPELELTDMNGVIKTGIKNAIIGFILGGVLSVVFYALLFVLQNRVSGPEDFSRRFELPVLGSIVKNAPGLPLDRWINSHRGLFTARSYDSQLQFASANIAQEAGDARKLLLLGTVKPEKIASLCTQLQPGLPDFQLSAGGDICSDADTVLALEQSDALLLVETIGESSHFRIENELGRLARSSKKLLGVLLLGNGK